MKKVMVLIGNCPSNDPRNTFSAANWALENDFEIVSILPGLIPSPVSAPSGAISGTSINQIFAITTEENFQKVTGRPYDLNAALKVQLIMGKEQAGKLQAV